MTSKHLTIGFRRAIDGHFDILATFNFENCPKESRGELELTARQMALELDAEILEGQVTPSTIQLDEWTAEPN
jgi:hypothetical protein